MTITADEIKLLREQSGAGMMDCKKALQESSGNMGKAIDWLRTKGLSTATKKAGRVAAQGLVTSYIHGEGRIGVLLEVNAETDFVARNLEFQSFVKDIAMHIAATHPLCVSLEQLPPEEVSKEEQILRAKALEEGKNEKFLQKIIEGQLAKWKKGKALLEQPFVKDPDKTVRDILTAIIAKIGENIVIRRFTRYELGEGIEVKKMAFADEVAMQQRLNEV